MCRPYRAGIFAAITNVIVTINTATTTNIIIIIIIVTAIITLQSFWCVRRLGCVWLMCVCVCKVQVSGVACIKLATRLWRQAVQMCRPYRAGIFREHHARMCVEVVCFVFFDKAV